MTDQKIRDLAKKYVDEVYNGDMDFYDEAISIIGFVFRDYCIVSREKVINEYEDAKADVEFEYEINDSNHMNLALGRMTVLHSIFGTEIFEERSEKN